jgi:hypothetical protein
MARVPLLPGVSFDQSLFIFHRNAILFHDELRVVRLVEEDMRSADRFLRNLALDINRDEISKFFRAHLIDSH